MNSNRRFLKNQRLWPAFVLIFFSNFCWPNDSLDFSLTAFEGGVFHTKDYVGKKKIVINFWASWCSACVEEIGELNELKRRFDKGDVIFLAINAGEARSKIKKFLQRNQFDYLILEDHERKVSKGLKVFSLPQTMVISKEGKIIYQESRPPKEL